MIRYAEPLEILRFATRDDLRAEIARQQEEIEGLRQDLADLKFMLAQLGSGCDILRAQKRRLTQRVRVLERGRG